MTRIFSPSAVAKGYGGQAEFFLDTDLHRLFQQVHFTNGLLLKAVSRTRNTFLRSAFLLFAAAQ